MNVAAHVDFLRVLDPPMHISHALESASSL
jgi:hypothetical protein